jgi:hypothetical protein
VAAALAGALFFAGAAMAASFGPERAPARRVTVRRALVLRSSPVHSPGRSGQVT